MSGFQPAAQGTAAEGLPEIPNLRQVDDELLSAGQPTREDLEALAEAGYRTVVDLRTVEEDRGFDEPAVVRELGMRYVSIPVGGLPLDPTVTEALGAALADSERPILVHCRSGNRVGAYYALYLHQALDAPPEEALQRGQDAGMTSEALIEAVREALSQDSGHDG